MPAGRPSKYKPEYAEQAEKLARLGLTDVQMAAYFEVTEKTFNTWKQHPEFLQSLKRGKDESDSKVVEALYKRATGYEAEEFEDVMYKGNKERLKKVKHIPADTTAQIFWLCNRQPEHWKNKREVKVTDDEGKPFVIVKNGEKKK